MKVDPNTGVHVLRRIMSWSVVLCGALLSGCAGVAIVGTVGGVVGASMSVPERPFRSGVVLGSVVTIRLAEPRDIAVVRADMTREGFDVAALSGVWSDSTVVRGATAIKGRVVSGRNDSLLIEVSEVRRDDVQRTFLSGSWVAIVRDSSVAVVRAGGGPSRKKGFFLGVLVAWGITLALIAAFYRGPAT